MFVHGVIILSFREREQPRETRKKAEQKVMSGQTVQQCEALGVREIIAGQGEPDAREPHLVGPSPVLLQTAPSRELRMGTHQVKTEFGQAFQ